MYDIRNDTRLSLCACNGGNGTKPPKELFYTNPVFEPVFADTTVIRDDDGTYYAYGTSDYSEWNGTTRTAYIPMLSSKDMVTWRSKATCLRRRPAPTGNLRISVSGRRTLLKLVIRIICIIRLRVGAMLGITGSYITDTK